MSETTVKITEAEHIARLHESWKKYYPTAFAALTERGGSLDAAWAAAALPEGLDERALSFWWDNRTPAGWRAAATDRFNPIRPLPIVAMHGTAPAALLALAAALRERGE